MPIVHVLVIFYNKTRDQNNKQTKQKQTENDNRLHTQMGIKLLCIKMWELYPNAFYNVIRHTQTDTQTHIHIHTYTYTWTHTHTDTHTHTTHGGTHTSK